MSDTIFVALLSLVGTLIGSVLGILTANRLTNYRIEQLEKKVNEHNNLVSRMYAAEKREDLMEEKIRSVSHRVDELECGHGK